MAVGPISWTPLPLPAPRRSDPAGPAEQTRVAPVPPVERRDQPARQTVLAPDRGDRPDLASLWRPTPPPVLELQPGDGFRVVEGPRLTATALDTLHGFRETAGLHIEPWGQAIAAYSQAQTLTDPPPTGLQMEVTI